MDHWVLVLILVGASLLVSVYTVVRLHMILSRIRSESKKSFEIASRVVEDWEQFSGRASDERQRMDERFERFESATRDRVDRFEKVASSTRERLVRLEQYLKEFFEVELKTVFDSFDKTVASILGEMKAELLRGIDRIEEIQAVVDSKSLAQDRILDGEGSVYRLLTNPNEGEEPAAGEGAPEESETAPEPGDDGGGPEEEAEAPPFRLEGDELE